MNIVNPYVLCLRGLQHPSPELRAMNGEIGADAYLDCFLGVPRRRWPKMGRRPYGSLKAKRLAQQHSGDSRG